MTCLQDILLKDVSLPIRELGKRKVSKLSVGEVTRTSEWHSSSELCCTSVCARNIVGSCMGVSCNLFFTYASVSSYVFLFSHFLSDSNISRSRSMWVGAFKAAHVTAVVCFCVEGIFCDPAKYGRRNFSLLGSLRSLWEECELGINSSIARLGLLLC